MHQHASLIVGAALIVLSGCAADVGTPSQVPAAPLPSAPSQVRPAGQEKYEAAIAACMQQRGWDASLLPGGGIDYGAIPTAQKAQFDADDNECDTETASLAPSMAPRSESLFKLNYQRTAAAYACLEANGYSVDPLPSYQQWRDRLGAGDDYSVMGRALTEETQQGGKPVGQIADTCPDPSAFFYDPTTRIYPDAVDYDAYVAGK